MLALGLVACARMEDHHGFSPQILPVEQIKPHVHTKDDVFKILGSPSTTSSYGADAWYYVYERVDKSALRHPKIIEDAIVIISFNKKNIVEKVDQQKSDQPKLIKVASEETPVDGGKGSLLKELAGNVSRRAAIPKKPS